VFFFFFIHRVFIQDKRGKTKPNHSKRVKKTFTAA